MVFQNFRLIFKPRIAPNPALLAQPLIIFRGHITTRTKILAATTTPSEIKGGVGGCKVSGFGEQWNGNCVNVQVVKPLLHS
jgi:hypothetical protein